MPDKIGFIGTGDIAAPMIRYLAGQGRSVVLSERSEALSRTLEQEFETVTRAANQSVIDQAQIIFLCLRPETWASIVPELNFRADQEIISVMSRVSMADLTKACAPAQNISITIPMAAMEHGGCPLPVFPPNSPMDALFGQHNPVLPQANEADMAAHFAASTMLSAVLGSMHEGATWLGDQTQNPESAEIYVTALVRATLRDVPLGEGNLIAARDALATPDTLNLMMVEGLSKGSVPETLKATLTRIKSTFDA